MWRRVHDKPVQIPRDHDDALWPILGSVAGRPAPARDVARARHGPDRDVIFRQSARPGWVGLSAFAAMYALGVTVAARQDHRRPGHERRAGHHAARALRQLGPFSGGGCGSCARCGANQVQATLSDPGRLKPRVMRDAAPFPMLHPNCSQHLSGAAWPPATGA